MQRSAGPRTWAALALACAVLTGQPLVGAAQTREAKPAPALPGGKDFVSDTGDDFLKPLATLRKDVEVAKTAPTVEFLYYPGQTYAGKPWSAWGDSLAVNGKHYVASIKADPTGRYLYYVPGAHGAADADGSPVVQYDVRTGRRKVLAFLHPCYKEKYGCALKGTYSLAVDPKGDRLYITWNANRAAPKAWDTVALTVVRIPESERQP
jgi:hypothetical protein